MGIFYYQLEILWFRLGPAFKDFPEWLWQLELLIKKKYS